MHKGLSPVRDELQGIALGDERLNRRAGRIAEQWGRSPQDSFVELAPTSADLEAMYRFYGNEDVDYRAILEPHVQATTRRCGAHEVVLVVHDSSEFVFPGERVGLTPVTTKSSTFFGHFALAVLPGEQRVPLGLLSMEPFLSERGARGVLNRGKGKKKVSRAERYAMPREQKESHRWDRGVDMAHAAVANPQTLIHVCDREGDDFALLAKLVSEKKRFVVRAEGGRPLATSAATTDGVVGAAPQLFSRSISISSRRTTSGAHVQRKERRCRIGARAATVHVRAPKGAQCDVDALSLNVVEVFEIDPPAGEEPVRWVLYTTEPIDTAEQVAFVIDAYRSRWVIEEYFKSIKTGCAFEKRQLTTSHALLNALALCLPIAWQLLLIRNLGRSDISDSPATTVLSNEQLVVLRVLAEERRVPVPPSPTVRQAMLLIAAIGGHLKSNGDPGWQTLGRGFMRLQENLDAARRLRGVMHLLADDETERSDQS